MSKSVEEVLGHHMSCLASSNVEGLLEDYTDQSILFSPDGVFEGREQIKTFLNGLVTMMLPAGTSFTSVRQDKRGETVFLMWQAESRTMKFHLGTDTLVIRDGKIVTHTFAAAVQPKE
ncbi:hypothetical protein BAL199_03259 [alpha proteobacterium BAL199]|jgi:ketosteroid isomerase-like protein|nr:hypothetical protein BAL199_03259 [alpha proteobacterium BAL199]